MLQGDLATAIRGLLAAGLAVASLAASTAARGGEPLFVIDIGGGAFVGTDHDLPRLLEDLIRQEGAFSGLGDFVVLDRNLFETPIDDVDSTNVLKTVFNGLVVYETK